MGDATDPDMEILCGYQKKSGLIKKPSGNIELTISNTSSNKEFNVKVSDHVYGNPEQTLQIGKGSTKNLTVNAGGSYGWYDFSVQIDGFENFDRRFSGRVETGKPSKSDPYMGRV